MGYYKFFSSYIKMNERTYCQRNRKTVLNRSRENYENNEEVLREKGRNKYKKLWYEKKKCKERTWKK